jgi:hypothetical protein
MGPEGHAALGVLLAKRLGDFGFRVPDPGQSESAANR